MRVLALRYPKGTGKDVKVAIHVDMDPGTGIFFSNEGMGMGAIVPYPDPIHSHPYLLVLMGLSGSVGSQIHVWPFLY